MDMLRRIILGVLWGIVGMMLLSWAIVSKAQSLPPTFPPEPVPDNPNINAVYTEVATYFAEVGLAHRVCFSQPNTNADGTPQQQWFHLRRYRVEGGGYEAARQTPFTVWVPGNNPDTALDFCVDTAPLAKAGHWVYEAALCNQQGYNEAVCSNWVSALVPNGSQGGAGSVDSRPVGWWVYAYLPRPGGVGVD